METFEDLLDLTPSKLHPVALKLKDMILAIDLSAFEVMKRGERIHALGPF